MLLDEIKHDIDLEKILYRLKKVYGTKLILEDASPEELAEICEFYQDVKTKILNESEFNTYHSHPEYAKASLICEAIRIFLSEISPVRPGAKVRSKKIMKNNPNLVETEDGKEIKPEIDAGKDMWKDGGQTGDGKDNTGDFHDDRDPEGDHGYDKYDYNAIQKLINNMFLIEPETGDDDDTSELESESEQAKSVNDNVAKRYELGPGPDGDDYHDDRNPTSINKMMDGPGYHEEDVIDKLAKNKPVINKDTKVGLPDELETGIEAEYEGDRKNGVRAEKFNQSPKDTEQREIPAANDLQADNKKYYNGGEEDLVESLLCRKQALKMINELNRPRSFNKLTEAAQRVAKETNTQPETILDSYINFGHYYLNEHSKNIKDSIYQEAMITALKIRKNNKFYNLLETANKTQDKDRTLFKFLINKAKSKGLIENEIKQFAIAAHNALVGYHEGS